MRIIKHSTLVRYWEEFPDTQTTLKDWFAKTSAAEWKNPAHVKATFPQVDQVRVKSGNTIYVFNIGRAHRLLAAIHFDFPRLFILRVIDHKEYDRNHWKEEL